jgi:hypothetical protein
VLLDFSLIAVGIPTETHASVETWEGFPEFCSNLLKHLEAPVKEEEDVSYYNRREEYKFDCVSQN